MSYFIGVNTVSGWRPRGRELYSTKQEAENTMQALKYNYGHEDAKIFDVDHEPGRTFLRNRIIYHRRTDK